MAAVETVYWMEEVIKLKLGVRTVAPDLRLRLFTNIYSPDHDSTPGDFTELSVGGYSAKTLDPGGWTVSTGSLSASATRSDLTWTFPNGTPAGTNIRGYYVTDEASDPIIVVVAEQYATVHTVPTTGEVYGISPTVTQS